MRGDGIFDRLARLDVNTVRLCVAGLVAAVVAVILVIKALDDGETQRDHSEVLVLSRSQLLARACSLSHPVYWVGPQQRTKRYELTSKSGGQVYVRYLPSTTQAANQSPDFLVVGTYAVPDARGALETAANSPKRAEKLSRRNGFEMMSAPGTKHAYVVFDDQPELQIEIFSPRPGEAEKLATSGSLRQLTEG